MKLNIHFTLLFFLSAFTLSFAQISIDNSYFPVAGDTLFTTIADGFEGVSITSAGGDQTWNFSGLSAGVARVRPVSAASEGNGGVDFPNADVLVYQATGAEGFYNVTDTEFSIIGYFGEDPLEQGINVSAPFSPAYVERWAPLEFFDLNANDAALNFAIATADVPGGIFDDLPITPDSIRAVISTSRTDLVDAWGTLMIPGGEYEVLRERREEEREILLEAKIGGLPWFDITDIALEFLPIDELGTNTTITYTFWSNEAKEPIAVITADETEEITTVEYKTLDIVNDIDDVVGRNPSLEVFPNPTMGNVRFDLSGFDTDNYELALFNLTGKMVWSKNYTLSGEQKIETNFGHLPKGYYLYALTNSRGEKLFVNRLVIVKP